MRWVLALGLLGCGRMSFDAGTDGGPSDGPAGLAITDPADRAEVGATITLRGTCIGGTVDVSGNGVSGSPTAQCASGVFDVIVDLTAGFGDKLVTVTQSGAGSVSRTFVRVPQTPQPFTARSGTTTSAGPATSCNLVIASPPGISPGQLIVGMIHSDGGLNAAISTPGFTRLQLDTSTSVAFFKVVGFTEPSQYTFSINSGTANTDTCASGGVLVGIKNVDPANPIAAQSMIVAFDDAITAPSITATSPTTILGVFGSKGPLGGITAPPGMMIDASAAPNGSFAVSSDGAGNALIAWEEVGDGATGTRTATLPAMAPVSGGLIALQPN